MNKLLNSFICMILCATVFAQDMDSLVLANENKPPKEYVKRAFKSSRVINGHSIEMIPKGNLDVRILHRFGLINSGVKNFFGLDEANMRMGFDYGVSDNFTIGIGRSTIWKELDAFMKLRLIRQSVGEHSSPITLVMVGGSTLATLPYPDASRDNRFSSRMSYFGEVIVGRKFTERFSLQMGGLIIHRNKVPLISDKNKNDVFALEFGGRIKLSRRVAFVADYHPIITGVNKDVYEDPFAVGFDIETGGHVFQLHFSNTLGMNEKAFITDTKEKWGRGDVRFGFNLSRMFVLKKKKEIATPTPPLQN